MASICWWDWGLLLLLFLPKALYLRSAQKTLQKIPAAYRTMRPALVWLSIIQLVYFIWNFVVNSAVKNSLQKLNAAGGLDEVSTGAYAPGLVSPICTALFPFLNIGTTIYFGGKMIEPSDSATQSVIAVIGLSFSASWLVSWIMNWIGIVAARRRISASPVARDR